MSRSTRTSVPPDHVALRVELSGAKGGHSGGDIAAGRVNAIKALGRVLAAASRAVRLAALAGGVSRNAIPRDAAATVASRRSAEPASARPPGPSSSDRPRVRGHGRRTRALLRAESDGAAGVEASRRAIDLVQAIPTGVLAMTPGLPGVVATSTSLTTAATENGALVLGSMTRSSNAAALDGVLSTMHALARLGGAEIEVRSYPPWEPDLDSSLLRDGHRRPFARLFGAEPALTVVHGGLECAVLGQKLPGVEMVSIGPEIVGPHAPGEKVRISSTQRFYRLLGALLDDLSR